MSSFFLLQHYGCFCRSSSSLLLPLLLESAGHLCSHKVPIIQMMSHMSVADELNAKQFISRYSPESLPVWPWKMCLKAAERMPPKQPCTNRDCFIWIWMSTCRNKQHKCSYCSWNWIDIRLFFLYANAGSYRDNWGCELNVCTNTKWWAVTEESHGDFKCHWIKS